MSFFPDFPDFPETDVPDEIRAAIATGELRKTDYRNDACPSVALAGPDDPVARLFILENEDAARMAEMRGEPRFLVVDDENPETTYYHGDDIAAALSVLREKGAR